MTQRYGSQSVSRCFAEQPHTPAEHVDGLVISLLGGSTVPEYRRCIVLPDALAEIILIADDQLRFHVIAFRERFKWPFISIPSPRGRGAWNYGSRSRNQQSCGQQGF